MIKIAFIDIHTSMDIGHIVTGILAGAVRDRTKVFDEIFTESADAGFGEMMENLLILTNLLDEVFNNIIHTSLTTQFIVERGF